MNRKIVVYCDIEIPKNVEGWIFAYGANLASKSRFFFILSYSEHILGSIPKMLVETNQYEKKNKVNNWDFIKAMKNTTFYIFNSGTNFALKSQFLFISSHFLALLGSIPQISIHSDEFQPISWGREPKMC